MSIVQREAGAYRADLRRQQGDKADLIARLEAATEGSGDLDYEIWDSLGTGALGLADKPRSIKRYTESLDAALTLVPAIWRIYAIQESHIEGEWFAGLDRRREHRESMIGKAPTPALALCIAALKARADNHT